ncbi:MAG TPA: DUF4325 domain-containing protein [Candidatus Saccharimonadia bacterium]|nr:DUF4325 domain-containing protein [Candidatus Saccharimonadia bacterium]
MGLKEQILEVAEAKKHFKTADVMAAINDGAARSYVSTVINSMVSDGALVREGSGRWSIYALPKYADTLGKRIKKRLANVSLEEYEVFDAIKKEKPFLNTLRENIQSVLAYAFSEMLNNAIEHSGSKNIEVEIQQQKDNLTFVVRDFGVGVFRNVMAKRGLASELEAIQDLLKGKTTTAPQAHSGEGIFFTSKAGDLFVLESYGLRLRIDNVINDVFVEEVKADVRGTQVTFQISTKSKRHLSEVFAGYQVDPEEPAFDQTEVKIRLYTMGTIYVSRSQARRVLVGLDKFRRIILDFDKVPTVGQAFSDEIFRVFQSRHPEIEIAPVNMNDAVKFMVGRVDKPTK